MHARPAARLHTQSIVARSVGVFREGLRSSTAAASVITATIAFLAYLSAIAPDLTWSSHSGDGGELITASFTLGVAHPPGYPIYIVLGKAFSMLPIGTIAFRYNLLSALSLSVTAGVVAAIVIRSSQRTTVSGKIPSRIAGVVAGLSVAFVPLVWGQAIVAEVYALNLAFLAAYLLALTFSSGRAHYLGGLFLGLSCSSHPTSLLMLPVGLVIVPRNSWFRLAAGFLAGLAPLLLLPFLGRSGSPLIWGRPDTLAGWWRLISADIFRSNVFGLAPSAWWPRLREWTPILASNILLLAVPVALVRTRHSSRAHSIVHNSEFQAERSSTIHNAPLILVSTAILYAIFAFSYAGLDAEVLLLPALLALGVLLGLRIGRLGPAALLLPAGLLLLNLQSQNLSHENSVRATAEGLLREVPPEALIVTPGDQSFATLSYFLEVEGQRPDLTLVDANLFQFDWYRQRLSKDIPTLRDWHRDDLRTFIGQTLGLRPVCVLSLLSTEENFCLNRSS